MRKKSLCLTVFAGLALAQHHVGPPPPEKPVTLISGLGSWTHSIHTKSAEAQKYFDQGINLLFSFNRYESLRSFRKASELDPAAIMPYWGIAMALGPYINMDGDPSFDLKESCTAIAKGRQVSGAPERERAYLEAAAARCPEYQPQTYIAAMRTVAERWPDDLDAQVLYAESLMIPPRWHWYGADGTPAAGVPEAERVLESVLRHWPQHPGANHYYIHAVEASRTPERAIPSAQRLMGVVPAAGHMVHMPGHIWLLLGDWEMAASVNERAVALDRKYFADTNVSGSYALYYVHNLHFVAYARWMQGNKAQGLRAAEEMTAALTPFAETMTEVADPFIAWASLGRVRFHDWDAILKAPQPKPAMKASTLIWRYSRAAALLARGNRTAALEEQQAFEAERKSIPPDAPWGMQNKATEVLSMVSEELAARLAATPAQAVEHWWRAVEIQGKFIYDEPPAWYFPLRESLGVALLRAGNAPEAEKVFREGAQTSPRNGRMLFGLMESLRAQGKAEQAEWVRKEFDAAWAKADVKLKLDEM